MDGSATQKRFQIPAVSLLIVHLAARMAAGTAPGRDMLCAARLVPLSKPKWGSSIHRDWWTDIPTFCGKAILKKYFKADHIGSNQS